MAQALVGNYAPSLWGNVAVRRVTLIALLALIALPWILSDRFTLLGRAMT